LIGNPEVKFILDIAWCKRGSISKIYLKEKRGKLWTESFWLSIVNCVDQCELENVVVFSEILEVFLDKAA
jgi:hypothetical protein